jgi:hypothetical protein
VTRAEVDRAKRVGKLMLPARPAIQGAETGQNDPKTAENDPKMAENDPKMAENDPKMAQNDPEMAENGGNWAESEEEEEKGPAAFFGVRRYVCRCFFGIFWCFLCFFWCFLGVFSLF